MGEESIALFALGASRSFGERIASKLNIPLSEHEERDFEDGEHKVRPLVNVRGRDVFVIHSLYSDHQQSVNDKFCRLLFFLGCLKDASAARVTAVIPYLAYARKDRKTQPRDPVTSRYVASLIEAMGTDRVITLDVHNLAAYQNAFRCRCDHLEANPLLVDHFVSLLKEGGQGQRQLTVLSPDAGGVKRARRFGEALGRALEQEVGFAFMEKARAKGILTIGQLVGDVDGSTVIIIDDLIASGGTLLGAARTCRQRGAARIYAAASHGVFIGGADKLLAADELERVIVTDTIPPFRLDPALASQKLTVLPASDLFAEAIRRLHDGGSLVDLMAI